jgi:mRNA-degrading endonuclease RelE of RelBE toxin-antitoxin system
MKLRFSKSAVKFLEKIDTKNVHRIREKLASLLHLIEERGVIPFTSQSLTLKGSKETGMAS